MEMDDELEEPEIILVQMSPAIDTYLDKLNERRKEFIRELLLGDNGGNED